MMDNFQYIQVDTQHNIIQAMPGSTNTDTTVIEIRRLSDDYTWNFTSETMTSGATTGTMTFVNDILWKEDFTPPTEDTYIVTITNSTLDVQYVQVLNAKGNAAPAGLTGNEFTTRSNVKEYLQISDTGNDTLIDNLITRCTKKIQNYCNRKIVDDDYTEYHDGDGSNVLLVDEYPINSIASIYDDVDHDYGSDSLISTDDIIFNSGSKMANRGEIRLEGITFQEGQENIKITYNAGYATIPSDLEQACIFLVGTYLMEAVKGVDIQVEGQDDLPRRLKQEHIEILNAYKNIK